MFSVNIIDLRSTAKHRDHLLGTAAGRPPLSAAGSAGLCVAAARAASAAIFAKCVWFSEAAKAACRRYAPAKHTFSGRPNLACLRPARRRRGSLRVGRQRTEALPQQPPVARLWPVPLNWGG